MADIPDPTIRLSIPGSGTFDLCTVAAAGESCSQTLTNGNPDTTIDANGFASFAVKNVDQNGLAVDAISFIFQTHNLFQPFSAFADDFENVLIRKLPNEGCPFTINDHCENPVGRLEVDFSGMQKPNGTPGSFSIAGVACDFDNCPTQTGFDPGSSIDVTSEYNFVTDPPCCDGIQPNEEQQLTITSDVPEPSSLVLLLGAGGLLAFKRRFKFYRG